MSKNKKHDIPLPKKMTWITENDIMLNNTSMKWISYQISTSYNELYLINSGISGRERERERKRERERERDKERERERHTHTHPQLYSL